MGITTSTVSMADALFSNTQQSVLGLLFGQPGNSFYTNEVIKRTGSGSGAVQRELSKLTQSGLVTVQRIGSQKHYQANPEAPIFDELCAIVQKTSGLVTPIELALSVFDSQIEAAFIYGSVAQRKDTASSDIDLMLLSDDLSYADIYPILEELSQQLGRRVEPTIYSVDEFQSRLAADNAFIRKVMDQPKLWIKGDESELGAG